MTSMGYQGNDAKMTKSHCIGGVKPDEYQEKSVDGVLHTQHQQPGLLNNDEIKMSAGKTTAKMDNAY